MTRRPPLRLALALLLGLVAAPIAPSVAGPPASSIKSLGAVLEGDTISVSGRAVFGGLDPISVGTDAAGDGLAPAELGLDLTGALLGQPEAASGDLLFVFELAQLPETGAVPEAARYSWDFAVKDLPDGAGPVAFRIDGTLSDVSGRQTARRPSFLLRGSCRTSDGVTTCVDLEALRAVVDPLQGEIRATVPRRLLEDQLDAALTGTSIAPATICDGISARLAAHGALCAGAGADVLTQSQSTAYPVSTRVVRLAVAPTGEAPDFSSATEAALTPDGKFIGFLEAAGATGGDSEVWAQACFGSNCAVSSVPLGTPAQGLTERWNPPVLVHATQAHRETSLALSPADPNLMFVCAPSGVPNFTYNQSYFHRSKNGGASWTPLNVEGPATDPRNYAFEGGDCDVAFDAGGTMYTADTWLGNLSVGRSTDGGQTWDGTLLAVSVPIVDRPWLVGGPPGTVHLSYQDYQCCMPSAIWYTRSTDYGKTFLPAVPVADAGPNGAFTWEGNFAVSPDGSDLYLVYTRRQGAALESLDSAGPETVWVAASHDAGLTWTQNLVASMPNPASYLYPSIAMDAGGYLHVVYASRTAGDRPIWYSSSKDGARTWLPPVPILRGAAGYSPWVAGGAPGEAAVVWYGSPDPDAGLGGSFDWYFYWARVTGGNTASPSFTAGTTTTQRMFRGSTLIPEFENVHLDEDGLMHIGMSAYRRVGGGVSWAIYYQRQSR